MTIPLLIHNEIILDVRQMRSYIFECANGLNNMIIPFWTIRRVIQHSIVNEINNGISKTDCFSKESDNKAEQQEHRRDSNFGHRNKIFPSLSNIGPPSKVENFTDFQKRRLRLNNYLRMDRGTGSASRLAHNSGR